MPISRLDQCLTGCPLFRGMSTPERHEIFGLLEVRTYTPGQTIIEEGQSLQYMWFVLTGRCQVLKSRPGGGQHELSVLEACSVFGEMSFFHPAPHSATVKAITDVEVGRLTRDSYDMLLRVGSLAAYKLAYNTVNVLSERLRRMDVWTCDLVDKIDAAGHHEEWRDFQSKLYSGWTF